MTGTDKKAKILKDDIANLVEFALNNGISEKRIVDLAEQAYDKYIERKKSSSTNIFYISIAVFVLIAAIAFSYNATWDLCHALIRIGLVKVKKTIYHIDYLLIIILILIYYKSIKQIIIKSRILYHQIKKFIQFNKF